MIEKGKDLGERVCPSRDKGNNCMSCSPCNLVCGLGGAGAFSDGKLTLTPEVGGWLKDYQGLTQTEALVKYIDQVYLRFGAPEKLYGEDVEAEKWRDKAKLSDLKLITFPLRHMGTENCYSVLKSMRVHLNSHLDIRLKTTASELLLKTGRSRALRQMTETGMTVIIQYWRPDGKERTGFIKKQCV